MLLFTLIIFNCVTAHVLDFFVKSIMHYDSLFRGVNDSTTLKNRHKYVTIGVEFVSPRLHEKWIFSRNEAIKGSFDATGSEILENIMSVHANLYCNNVCHSTISDYAAKC